MSGVLTGHVRSFVETPDRPCWPPLPFGTGFTHLDLKVWGNWLSVNPFDDDAGSFFVVVNDEGRRTVRQPPLMFRLAGAWFAAKPIVLGCVEDIEQNWSDVWLKSLRERLAAGRAFDR